MGERRLLHRPEGLRLHAKQTNPSNPPTDHPTKPDETTAKRPTYDPTEPTQDNGVDPTSGPGMAGGAVAGVVIAVIASVALAAVLVVMLRNRNWEVRRLLPASMQTSTSSGSAFQNMSYSSGSGGTASLT